MANIGEVKRGREISKSNKTYYIWVACIDCGKQRWVGLRKGVPVSKRCRKCAAILTNRSYDKGSNWKGGRYKDAGGYSRILLLSDDFFYSMATKSGYVLEHRLVVAKALGRNLHSWEIVHYKKGYAKDDNRYPETLQLVTDDRHKQITILENRISRLEGKVEEQSKLIKLLQWQLKEFNKEGAKEYGC